MTANLKIKNDRYYAVINYKDGAKYKQKWVALGLPAKNNKRKAESMLPEIVSKFEAGNFVTSGNTLLTEYAIKWLEKVKPNISPTTYMSYERCVRNYIIRYFEPLRLRLKDARRKHVLDYLDYYTIHGTTKGGKLSSSLMEKIQYYLYAIFQQAVSEEILSTNPAANIKPRAKRDNGSQKRNFLSTQEANKLLAALKNETEIYPIVYITLCYGLRRSEVMGLKWDSVDFKKNTLSIKHSVVLTNKVIEKDVMKTKTSNHVYALLPNVKQVLLKVYDEYLRMKANPLFEDKGYVFCREDGDVIHPQRVTRLFSRALERYGFQHIRFHDLRHSTASILYENGWGIKEIQAWLRHACLSVTSDIYTHLTKDREQQIGVNINNIIGMETEVNEDEKNKQD